MSKPTLLETYVINDLKLKSSDPTGDAQNLWISENGEFVTFQLSSDFMVAPFGVSTVFGQSLASAKRKTLDLKCNSLIESKILSIEEHVKQKLEADNRKIEFHSLIRPSKDSRYENTLRSKLSVDGVKVVSENLHPLELSDVKAKSNVKVIAQLRNVWKKGIMYGLTLEVKQIMVLKKKKVEFFDFL